MIKYTSKDIIERACQLADLQNSDFISDSEKSALLNEAWNTLYQKIVNANDRTFIKSVYVSDGFVLPKDFYQLASLYVESDRQQINKINASQLHGYSITNNVLLISHEYDDVAVIMEYYPTPKTLFYNSGNKVSRSFQETPKIIIDDDLYVGTDNTIYSYAGGSSVGSASIEAGVILCKNGYVARSNDVNVFKNLEGSIVRQSESPIVIKGNEVTYDVVKSDDDLSDYMAIIMDEAEEILYFVDSDGNLHNKNFERILVDEANVSVLDTLFYCRNDGLYMNSTNGKSLLRILGSVSETFPLGLYNFCAFVDKGNIIVSFGSNLYKMAYGFNSLFDYPNNIYFTLLAYSLAVSFKIKQNGDPTLLAGELEKATNQFFDSLSRDDNQTYIMKNVYRNGRGRIWS